jgi:alpha-tubulin suppressor-like RCC1 family protein
MRSHAKYASPQKPSQEWSDNSELAMRANSIWILCFVLLAGPACLKKDPLFCDENTPCMDPERPYCDLAGEFPASDGIKRTCIPSPFDAGSDPDAGDDRYVVDLAVGANRTCAILNDGGLRCWGSGPLGYSDEVGIVGDNEHPYTVGDVPTGGSVKQAALSPDFTCLLYEGGNVRCFGENGQGQLGYGHEDPVSSMPSELEDVSLGEPATAIATGTNHTCAILESGALRCWGAPILGAALGYAQEDPIGDNEVPSDLGAVEVGGAVSKVTLGAYHTCALLGGGDGRVRCWGTPMHGQLGYGDSITIGDDETPSEAGDVMMGSEVAELQAYASSNCAVFEDGTVTCWGEGLSILGYANTETIGDTETAAAAPDVELGGIARTIAGGPRCALMSDSNVRCWGRNEYGELGLGHTETIGDNEDPVDGGPVVLGGQATKLSGGLAYHQCVLLADKTVKCWGRNDSGQLGLSHQENVGNDEVPADVPAVRVLP